MRRLFFTLGLLALIAFPRSSSAASPSVVVSMHDGLVSIHATQATLGEILAEWSRVGGTEFVNSEAIRSNPMTLELTDVPEKDALAILMRPASGFLAVSRTAAVGLGSSRFARIVILPGAPLTSAAVAKQVPVTPLQRPEPLPENPVGVSPIIGPDGQAVADDQGGAPPFVPRQVPRPYGDAPPMPASPNAPMPNRPVPYPSPNTPYPMNPPPNTPSNQQPASPTGAAGSSVPGVIAPTTPPPNQR